MARGGGRPPKVFTLADAGAFVRAASSVAAARAGIELAIDASRAVDAGGLVSALAGAEREVAGATGRPGDAGAAGEGDPVGEWRVVRVMPGAADGIATVASPFHQPFLRPRVLTLTRASLIERRGDTYAALDRKPLTTLVSVAAPIGEPGRAVLAWADGPGCVGGEWEVETPDRDALVAALVAAVAGATARGVAVRSTGMSPMVPAIL